MAHYPLLLLLLSLALCTLAVAASSERSNRNHRYSRHRASILDVNDPPAGSTPWGPFTFSGSLNTSIQTFAFMDFTLPPLTGSNTPQLTPSLAGVGATFTLSSDSMSTCNYVLCATRLVRPFDNTAEWSIGSHAVAGRSDVCEAFLNVTTHSTSAASVTAPITPGLSHFAVFAQTSVLSTEAACPFTLTVSGDACSAGEMGTPTGCLQVSYTSVQDPFLYATLPASPADAAIYFEVHPTSVYAANLQVNVNSGGDNVTAFIHEGALPSLTGVGINTLADFNLSTKWAQGTTPLPYDAQAALLIKEPSYRTSTPNQRYFLGVTRTGGQQVAPMDSVITVQVAKEKVCPTGYHGQACEFFVQYVLDPFQLAGNLISTTSFAWNVQHDEIWYYAALLFVNIDAAQNFSVGLQALDGQLVPELYLRMGAIPTRTKFDARSSTINPAQIVRFTSTGTTLLHDAVWYVGVSVPITYPLMGDVALWINTPCPGTTTTRNADGTITVTECNGHGVCLKDVHQCRCVDRWSGWNCQAVDTTMGLSGGTRALIILAVLAGTALLGYFLCWWFREGMFRQRAPMANAGYGHHLDEGGAGGAGGGGQRPPPVERPAMGRI